MGRMNHDKSRSFFGGRGFYIALVLCLAAIGVAGYFVLVQQAKVAEEGKDKPVVRQEEVEDVQRAQMPEADPEPVQETLEPEELLPPETVEEVAPPVVPEVDTAAWLSRSAFHTAPS